MGEVIDLREWLMRDLTPRQRLVLEAVRAGAYCPLCGDLGAYSPEAGYGVPCIGCGVVGRAEGR